MWKFLNKIYLVPHKTYWYVKKDFLKKNIYKQGSYSILKIWGSKKAQKICFLQSTRVKNNIFENGFRRVVQFTLVHSVKKETSEFRVLHTASLYKTVTLGRITKTNLIKYVGFSQFKWDLEKNGVQKGP